MADEPFAFEPTTAMCQDVGMGRSRIAVIISASIVIAALTAPAGARESNRPLTGTPSDEGIEFVDVAAPAGFSQTSRPVANDPLLSDQPYLEEIGAVAALTGALSAPAPIGIIDNGYVRDHPDLDLEIIVGGDIACSHLTNVASIAGAFTDNGEGMSGVAPGGRLIVADRMGPSCLTVTSDWPDFLTGMADLPEDLAVVNMSFSGVYEDEESAYDASDVRAQLEAVQYATGRGVLVIGAGGNTAIRDDYDVDNFLIPANFGEVMAVGATITGTDAKAPFSVPNGIDIVAPGTDIVVADREDNGCGYVAFYCLASGTSFSAPMVSGAAALIASNRQMDNPWAIRHRLNDTARELAAGTRPDAYGSGMLNMIGALGDPVVRLEGPTRFETAEEIGREAVWETFQPGREPTHDRVVVVPGDQLEDWRVSLPALALAADPATSVVLSDGDMLSATAQREIWRILGDNRYGQRDDAEILLVGDAVSGVSPSVQETLARQYGADRVQRIGGRSPEVAAANTSVMIAAERPVSEVIIATDRDFADSLAMAPVAVTNGWPLLYVSPDRVPSETCEVLAALRPSRIHIAGGPVAVTETTEDVVGNCAGGGAELLRYDGATRIQTSIIIAEAFFAEARDVAVANAYNWPDAVLGGLMRVPIVLTANNPDGTLGLYLDRYLRLRAESSADRGIGATTYVLGGPVAINEAVEAEVVERH